MLEYDTVTICRGLVVCPIVAYAQNVGELGHKLG